MKLQYVVQLCLISRLFRGGGGGGKQNMIVRCAAGDIPRLVI